MIKTMNDTIKLKEKMKEMYGNEYSLLSTEYANARDKIEIKHNSCGTIFNMRVDAFFGKQKQQCPNKECVKQRIAKTNLEKYGTECVFSNQQIKAKIKNTMIQKYGVDSFFKDGLIQKSINDKYGINSSNQIKIDKKYVDILYNYDLLKEWGDDFHTKNNRAPSIMDFCDESKYDRTAVYKVIKDKGWNLSDFFNIETSSQYEQVIKDFLDKYGIQYILHDKKIIPPLEIEFFLPDFNI